MFESKYFSQGPRQSFFVDKKKRIGCRFFDKLFTFKRLLNSTVASYSVAGPVRLAQLFLKNGQWPNWIRCKSCPGA